MITVGKFFTQMCNSKNYELSLPVEGAITDLIKERSLTLDEELTTSALHTIHEKICCNDIRDNTSSTQALRFLKQLIKEKKEMSQVLTNMQLK